TVTGSCYLIETADKKIMIDCGMFLGARLIRERNYLPFPVVPASVDYLLLTHAHIDHTGLIPKFYKHGFKGRALAIDATVDLLEIMLPDCGYIQEMEVDRLNRKAKRAGKMLIDPIYTSVDAYNYVRRIERTSYKQVIRLDEDVLVRFSDAGHILGSSILELWVREAGKYTKVVFSGDLGSNGKPYINDPAIVEEADYVLMECTYGNRARPDEANRKEELHKAVLETHEKGGNLVIPVFAVERAQDLLYDLNLLFVEGRMPPFEIYIDSPMAVAVTEVFRCYQKYFDRETRELIYSGDNPLIMPLLHLSRTAEESMAINKIRGGAIILASSGMCEAGRIKHHLKHNLWRPESTVLIVGYQAEGTKGKRLLDGVTSMRIHGEEVAVKADIRSIIGYSSHADQEELLKWLGSFYRLPKKVFLIHGNPDALAAMERLVPERLGITAYAPNWQETVQLTDDPDFSAEELRETYESVASGFEDFIRLQPGQKEKEHVMRQLKDLKKIMGVKKGNLSGVDK
ncbi:MAG TPA: MBL fold metallo-hydrolase, partial [Clostridia bacterium]|nr:MBL fold metallo-hydrolase [Clostridia bacterium]